MDVPNGKENNFSIGETTISNLPDELILDIFLSIPFTDVCRCARVCRRWNAVAKYVELQKQIFIREPLTCKQLSKLLMYKLTENLEDLRFLSDIYHESSTWPLMSVERQHLLHIRDQCGNLKVLFFNSCLLNTVTLEDFPDTLKHLSLRRCEIDAVLFFGPNPGLYLPHLVCLDIGSIGNYITSQELYRLNHLTSLTALYMEDCSRINNGGILSIQPLLQQLEILDIEGTDISREGGNFILQNSPKMKKLFFGHTHINDGVFFNVDKNCMQNLTFLCVSGSYITGVGLLDFFMDFVTLNSALVTIKDDALPKNGFDLSATMYNNPSHRYPIKFKPANSMAKCEHYLDHECKY